MDWQIYQSHGWVMGMGMGMGMVMVIGCYRYVTIISTTHHPIESGLWGFSS